LFHVEQFSPHPDPDHNTELSDNLASEISRWAFFICGLILIIAAATLPLKADLDYTRHQRNLAMVIEKENAARNVSYQSMISAIESKNPDTLRLLAQSNMGLIPATHEALMIPGERQDPMVFELLEPAPFARPEFSPQYSRLERLVMVPKSRLWVIAGGIFLVLVGLLPAAKPK
jgi:hypothetical protein